MKNLWAALFVMFMCNPQMSLDLGTFNWGTPTGEIKTVQVDLFNAGDIGGPVRGIDLEHGQIIRLLDYAWTSCDGMADCDPHTREAFVIVDPLEWWLVFNMKDTDI